MIIVTGGAGMIGSAFVWKLNEMGIKDILIVDKLRKEDKWLNIRKREYYDWIDKDNLKEWLSYGSLFSNNRNRCRLLDG